MACFITVPTVQCGDGRHCCYAPISISQFCDNAPQQWEGSPPASPNRLPLEAWREIGCLPPGISAQEIRAAFTRAHGGKRQPRLWTPRGARKPCFTAEELLRSLAAVPPPPPIPAAVLALVWNETLKRVALPSTRLLLSQQAHLQCLQEPPESQRLVAQVAVVHQWMTLVTSRLGVLTAAMAETLGKPVAIELRGLA